MKLTKYDRQAFVKAVMADIPQIDYREQVRKLVYEDSIEQLPKCLQEAARDEKAKQYIQTTTVYVMALSNSFSVFGQRHHDYKLSTKIAKKLEELKAAHTEQKAKLDAVERKLTASIEACTTLKMAKERLPEFDKYLPQDRTPEKGAYLPAVANLVADLSTLGWPKDQKVEAKTKKKKTASNPPVIALGVAA
jgi:hypothetical protein